MVHGRSLTDKLISALLYAVAGLLGLLSLLPFVHVLSVSFSNHAAISAKAVTLWPIGPHLANYAYIVQHAQVERSFLISVARVAIGVGLNLLVIVVTAYPLSRDGLRMPGRTIFKVLLLFGMLFNGGLIPTFLSIQKLGLYDNLAVLVLPGALNIFFAIVVVNFFRRIPAEIHEAATVDGASHFDILFRIFLPLSLPSLATIALFSAVGHWNSWFDGILYLRRVEIWPLQSYVYSLVVRQLIEFGASGHGYTDISQRTPEGLSAAMIMVTALPIMLVYPFLQRYFLTGLTLGSVKG